MSPLRRPIPLALVAAALATLFTVALVLQLKGVTTGGRAYVRTFDYNDEPLEVALASGDGQAFAAIARDPALSHPEVFRDGPKEAAYRAQRPLVSYAAWLLSAGQPQLVPTALAVLFVLGEALMVGTAATFLERRGGRPELALALLVVPPSMAALRWFGPEPLGMGLALGGLLAWQRKDRRAILGATALFSLAALTRETYLVVPAGLALVSLIRRERPLATVMWLAVPAVAWLSWVSVVRARFGEWPWAAGGCRVADRPLGGFFAGREHWPSSGAFTVAVVVSLMAITAACLWRRRQDELTWVVASFAAVALFLGDCVWRRWQDFSRPLLPIFAIGFVVLLTRSSERVGRRTVP